MSILSIRSWDDCDNSVLTYIGQWARWNHWKAGGNRGTLSTTHVANATVTFTFPYPAIGVSLWGMTRQSTGGLYRACMDCSLDDPDYKWTSIDVFDPTDQGGDPPGLLFSRQWPTPKIHTVILQNLADPRGTPKGHSILGFDRAELQVPGPTQAPSPSPTIPTVLNIHSAALSSGAIAGIIIGSLVLVLLLSIIAFLILRLSTNNIWRRRQPLAPMPTEDSPMDDPAHTNRTIPYPGPASSYTSSLPPLVAAPPSTSSKGQCSNPDSPLSTNRTEMSEVTLNIHPASLQLDSHSDDISSVFRTGHAVDGHHLVPPKYGYSRT